jgi:hypothetical protein
MAGLHGLAPCLVLDSHFGCPGLLRRWLPEAAVRVPGAVPDLGSVTIAMPRLVPLALGFFSRIRRISLPRRYPGRPRRLESASSGGFTTRGLGGLLVPVPVGQGLGQRLGFRLGLAQTTHGLGRVADVLVRFLLVVVVPVVLAVVTVVGSHCD